MAISWMYCSIYS